MAKATKHFREYYKDPIMLRMANSIKVAELFQNKDNEKDSDSEYSDDFAKIDEIEEIENAEEKYIMEEIEVENSRIDFGGNEENMENEKNEEKEVNSEEEEKNHEI